MPKNDFTKLMLHMNKTRDFIPLPDSPSWDLAVDGDWTIDFWITFPKTLRSKIRYFFIKVQYRY